MKSLLNKSRLVPIMVLVFILVAAISTYCYFFLSTRNSASAAIENAENIIQQAYLTCDPDSDQAVTLGNSHNSLVRAREKFESGSFLSINAYGEAKTDAEKAGDEAQTMIDEMRVNFDRALAAATQLDFERAFAFYRRYPRTQEAEVALASTEIALNTRNVFLGAGLPEQDLISVQKISEFNSSYPKPEKPASVIDGTGGLLVDMAHRNITQLEQFVSHNNSSLEKISATHEAQKLRYMPDELSSSTVAVTGLMPHLYMPIEMQQLFTTMTEANQVAEVIDAFLLDSPNLNDSQIAYLNTRLSELQVKLDEAKSLLETITSKYYKGSEASQAGYAAGLKAAESANNGN